MDAFRFHDPGAVPDGVTHFVTLRTKDSIPAGTAAASIAAELDKGLGSCELQWQDLREMLADVLLSLDGEDYKLGDFIVMPNHVHLLVGMYPGRSISDQCADWITRSTGLINESRGRYGEFWHAEVIDSLVMDWDEFDGYRKYIRRDPKRADLRVGEYYHRIADEN